MADAFDRFLGSALAPAERTPDRDFVAVVQARVLLDERLAGERRRVVASLVMQLLGLAAVTAAALWIGRAASVANLFARAPSIGALTLLAGFGLVVALFSQLGRPGKHHAE